MEESESLQLKLTATARKNSMASRRHRQAKKLTRKLLNVQTNVGGERDTMYGVTTWFCLA